MAQFDKENQLYIDGRRRVHSVDMLANKNGDIVDTDNRFPVDIADQTVTIQDGGNSITVDGTVNANILGTPAVTVEPFNIRVSKGLVSGHTFIHKFGAVPSMSNTTTGTVWDKNDTLYPWSEFDSAGTVTVRRGNASDDGKTITIEGLDANYNPVSEDITISGNTTTGSTNFIRVFRAYVSNGSNNNADVEIEKNGTDVAIILEDRAQTLMGIYTIPAGKTGYLIKGNASISDNDAVTGDMYIRYFGETAFRIGHTFEVSGSGGEYDKTFPFPIPIPEKSDIDVRLTTRSNNVRATVSFDILLVDN